MMKASAALLSVMLATIPIPLRAQLGLGVRAGTFGVGAEAAIDLGGPLVLRGGVGYAVLEPTVRMTDINWTLELPSPWYNLGLDVYLNRALRLGGGVLFKEDDPRIVAQLDGPVSVGGTEFTKEELGSLVGTSDSGSRRPYALLGFGRHTRGSTGLFLDLGVVWLGDPQIRLSSEGGTLTQAELEPSLTRGEAELESSLGTYMKVWPILSLGARIAVG